MSVAQRQRPLSFAYRREADERELQAMETLRDALLRDEPAERAEVAHNLLLGAGLGVLIFPAIMLVYLAAQFFLQVPIGTPLMWGLAIVGWMVLWLGRGLWGVAQARRLLAEQQAALSHDIDNRMVIEESWRFVDVIAFQQVERIPVVYLLRADDGAVISFADARLPDRPSDASPFPSRAPADAVLVRAPQSGRVLSELYSGPALPVNVLHALRDDPAGPPEHGSVISVPWERTIEVFARP